MASSSVSQESLDMDDMDNIARRNRIRVHRGHSGRGSMPHRGLPDKIPFGDGGDQDRDTKDHHNGDVADGDLGMTSHSHLPADHESPTRGAAARLKDKRSRPNHVKGKLPKDKRKLREKRRSTGVVHCIPSTESTGDSLDEEDDDEDAVHDTKKNTVYNEGPTPGHQHQAGHEGRHSSNPTYPHQRRNKSPSDLEADLEDNQDYDSTVSHSETNLTLIGRSESSAVSQNLPGRQQVGSIGGMDSRIGGRGFSSKYSSGSSHTFKFNPGSFSSDADSSKTNTSTSSSSSLISRYREVEPSQNVPATTNTNGDSDSTRRFNTTTENKQNPQVQPRPLGFSVFSSSIVSSQRSDKPASTSYVSSASKFRDRDGGSSNSTQGSLHTRLAGYQAPRPFTSTASSSVSFQQSEMIAQLEKQLEKEKQENTKLQQTMEEKDKEIIELQRRIELLNKECDDLDADNIQLQEENKALIRAMSKLTSNV